MGASSSMVNFRPNLVKLKTIACGGILAGILTLSPPAAFCGTPRPTYAGAYLSHTGKRGPGMNVSLGNDGTATVTEDPGTGTATFFGYWSDDGSQVKVTFYPEDGRPAEPPMIFQPTHDGLQAVTWNHARWGNVAPPPMQKASKVKTTYWFTTVP